MYRERERERVKGEKGKLLSPSRKVQVLWRAVHIRF